MEDLMEAPAAVGQSLDSVWEVALPSHDFYPSTRLKAAFTARDSRHCVVMVDARKLLQCADRDTTDYVLPEVTYWHPGKARGIREFLDPRESRVPEMPYVTFSTRHRPSLLGMFGLAHEGVVSFRNGQHRARYMAFAGAVAFPVEVHETEAKALALYCGIDSVL
jgi:hypothetical protein